MGMVHFRHRWTNGRHDDRGFSLPELLISMSVMLLISGAATMALLKMTSTQSTIWNRTQMHSGVRGATEVLQQEVGQAGRVALPAMIVTAASGTGQWGTVSPWPAAASGTSNALCNSI